MQDAAAQNVHRRHPLAPSWVPAAVGALVVTALLLRLAGLRDSIWYDELWSTRILLTPALRLMKTVGADVHPPFYTLVLAFWIKMFGDSEISIRLPPLICGLLSIPLTVSIGTRLVGSKAGLLAGFLMTISPVHIWYSHEARQYSALLFLTLSGIYCYYKIQDGRANRRWKILFGASVFGAAFSHYYAGVFLAILVFLAWRSHGPERISIIRIGAVVLGLFLIFMGLKAATDALRTSVDYGRPFTLAEFWTLFTIWLPTGNALWPGEDTGPVPVWLQGLHTAVQLGIFAAVAAGLWKSLRRGACGMDLVLFVVTLPVVLLAMGIAFGSRTYIERSMFILLPFSFMSIGAGVLSIRKPWLSRAALILVIALASASLLQYFRQRTTWTVYKPKEDWRAATRYLSIELDRAGQLLILASSPADALTYYDDRIREPRLAPQTGVDPEQLRSLPAFLRNPLQVYINRSTALQRRAPDVAAARNGRIVMRTTNPENDICEYVSAHGIDAFHVILDRYWPGKFDNLYGDLGSEGKFIPAATMQFDGLTILKYAIAPGACPRDPAR